MRALRELVLIAALAVRSVYAAQEASCTLTASGGDDGPLFLNAVKTCTTVTIPKNTTLNIASALNMTGVVDKHIVCSSTYRIL